jgi:hypothetical protein
MMKEDRMGFARIRAPQEDQVRVLDFPIRARASSRTENSRQTGDAWRVSSPVTAVDIVAADDDTGKLLRHEIHLVRCLGAAKQSERLGAAPGDSITETLGRTAEGFLPGGGVQLTLVTHQRFGEADV